MRFRIRFADQIVGIFVLVAIVGIAVIFIFIGINQRWFARNYYFTSTFPSGEGLSNGMPIMLQGFEIGKVSRISLTPENRVDIKFYIQDTYYDRLLPHSVLQLVSSPIGLGTTLKLLPGKIRGAPLPEHSLVPSYDSPEAQEDIANDLVEVPKGEDVIGNVISKVNPILDEVKSAVTQIKKLTADVDNAIAGKGGPLGSMVADLSRTPAKINSTIDVVSQKVETITSDVNGITDKADALMERIDAVAANLQEISENLKSTSEGLKDTRGLAMRLIDPQGSISTIMNDNNALYNQVQDALTSVNGIIAQIKSFVDYINGTRPQISSILEKGSTALDQGKDVLEAVKNNPLLKGGVPEKKVQGATLKTYRDEDF
jgi:phospholipid/cholesterol/gamma-HCH transport system substrate-binding protein